MRSGWPLTVVMLLVTLGCGLAPAGAQSGAALDRVDRELNAAAQSISRARDLLYGSSGDQLIGQAVSQLGRALAALRQAESQRLSPTELLERRARLTTLSEQVEYLKQLRMAEIYYQRGVSAEDRSDAAWRRWQKDLVDPAWWKLSTRVYDDWSDQWVFALDMHANAVRLNPAHWQAHRRLGNLYAEGYGAHNSDLLAVLHLVAYLSLRPDDANAAVAKEVVDNRLARVIETHNRYAHVARAAFTALSAGEGLRGEFSSFVSQYDVMAVYGDVAGLAAPAIRSFGGVGDFGMGIQNYFLQHDAAEGLWTGRSDAAGNALAEAPNDSPEFQRMAADTALVVSANYIANYLYIISRMHHFMATMEEVQVPFDPRLPEALIGESVRQIRMNFIHQPVNLNNNTIHESIRELAAVPGLRPQEIFSPLKPGRKLPDMLMAAGTLESPEFEKAYYLALDQLLVYPSQSRTIETIAAIMEAEQATTTTAGGEMGASTDAGGGAEAGGGGGGGGGSSFSLATLFGVSVATDVTISLEAYKTFQRWKNIHLHGLARLLDIPGVIEDEDVFIHDFIRLGNGRLTPWVNGPGPLRQPATASGLPAERNWLFADADR